MTIHTASVEPRSTDSGLPSTISYKMPEQHELPASKACWSLESGRAVLLVHDMQRYFLRPFEAAITDPLTSNIVRLIDHFRAHDAPVAYTTQPGRMTTAQRGLLNDLWGPGMESSDEDRQVIDELTPLDGDWLFTKWRYSAFHRSDLEKRMRESGRDQLVVCGVYAHVGILVTAIDAFTHDIEAFIVADALGDFSRSHHDAALRYASATCAMVISADELLA